MRYGILRRSRLKEVSHCCLSYLPRTSSRYYPGTSYRRTRAIGGTRGGEKEGGVKQIQRIRGDMSPAVDDAITPQSSVPLLSRRRGTLSTSSDNNTSSSSNVDIEQGGGSVGGGGGESICVRIKTAGDGREYKVSSLLVATVAQVKTKPKTMREWCVCVACVSCFCVRVGFGLRSLLYIDSYIYYPEGVVLSVCVCAFWCTTFVVVSHTLPRVSLNQCIQLYNSYSKNGTKRSAPYCPTPTYCSLKQEQLFGCMSDKHGATCEGSLPFWGPRRMTRPRAGTCHELSSSRTDLHMVVFILPWGGHHYRQFRVSRGMYLQIPFV